MHQRIASGAPVDYCDDFIDSAIDDSISGRFREQITGFSDAEDKACADDGIIERVEAGVRYGHILRGEPGYRNVVEERNGVRKRYC